MCLHGDRTNTISTVSLPDGIYSLPFHREDIKDTHHTFRLRANEDIVEGCEVREMPLVVRGTLTI